MHRLALFATLAFTASTAAALPTDDGNTRPAPPSPTMGSPDALRRRQEPNTDGRSHHRAYPRGGFVAVDAGLTLAKDDATDTQLATGLGFTLGARLTRRVVLAGRAGVTLDTAGAPGRPPLRDVDVGFGVDVRAWRTVWLGAGLGGARHRFDDEVMTSVTPTARLRLGVDAWHRGATALFVTADWTTDLGADQSTQRTTFGLGLRYR